MLAYSYDRRHAKINPEELPRGLEIFLKILTIMEQAAPSLQGDYMAKNTLEEAYKQVAPHVRMLFLGLISSYSMDAKDRKVIENATKSFSRQRVVIRRGEGVSTFAKIIADWRTYYEVAKRVLEKGTTHSESSGTVVKAGPFNLINSGGFSDKVVQEVAKVVEQSAKLLQQKGLGRVCYGDIQITNTIHKSTRVLAFYQLNTDELFIRANLKGGKVAAIRSVCHELGHRLFYRFLKSKKDEIQRIYRILQDQEDDRINDLLEDRSRWPQPGQEIVEGRRVYVVDAVVYPSVHLHRKEDERQKAKAPLKGLLAQLAKNDPSKFVTAYAASEWGENFAEMIAFYVQDQLPDDQVNMLKGVL